MNYKEIYNEDYFKGKNSLFYKLGYEKFSKFPFDNLFKPINPYVQKIKAGKVLDVGCAYGLMLKRFPNSFEKYGTDISEYAINEAKKRLPRGTFSVSNAEERLPFQDDFFDIAVCNNVSEHLENPSLALKNIFQVLKNDGLLYVTTPNLNIFRKKVYPFLDKREHHISLLHRKDMRDLLEKIGFKIVEDWTSFNFTHFFFIKFNSNIGTESSFICQKSD
jgi:SAM-dependent methyltransferase